MIQDDPCNAAEDVGKKVNRVSGPLGDKVLMNFIACTVQAGTQDSEYDGQSGFHREGPGDVCPEKKDAQKAVCRKMKQLVHVHKRWHIFNGWIRGLNEDQGAVDDDGEPIECEIIESVGHNINAFDVLFSINSSQAQVKK